MGTFELFEDGVVDWKKLWESLDEMPTNLKEQLEREDSLDAIEDSFCFNDRNMGLTEEEQLFHK